jgi:HlyD family secretion protein
MNLLSQARSWLNFNPIELIQMTRRWFYGLSLLILLTVGEMVYLRLWLGPEITVEVVTVGDILQTIVASGRVQSPHRVEVGAQITSTVVNVAVHEGDQVTQGQTLLTLDSKEAQAGLELALASVSQALTRLRQLKELTEPVAAHNQEQADTNLQNAQSNLARSQQLFEQAFIGASAKEEAERQVKLARSQSLITQRQWRSVQSSGTEIATAQAVLQQANASVSAAKARLAYTRILAPCSGVLIARHVDVGDSVQSGKVLLVLSPAGETQLVVQIDEKNMKWIRLGQPALASADAYADQVFPAEVVFINPAVDPLRGSVEVRLSVPQAPAFLTQDMTVSVDIEVDKRLQVLQVPMSAVHMPDKADAWVLRVKDKRAIHTPVVLGLKNPNMAQVISGLQRGDALVPISDASLHDGSHLRVKKP